MSEITYNLLVVDDDERIRNLLSEYLIKEGFIVSTASGAEEARKKTQLIKFDLISPLIFFLSVISLYRI